MFFCKPVPIKISENFDIKHLRWSKIDLSKEKKILRKVTLRISEVVAWRCSVKREKYKKVTGRQHRECLQLFSCKFCQVSKNTFFVEHKRTAALGISLMKHNNAKKQK